MVLGGTSGSSVSSTDGIPVTKSISSGLQMEVFLNIFHPKYNAKNSGMLISINVMSGTTDEGTHDESSTHKLSGNLRH